MKHLLSSWRVALSLLLVYAIALAVATGIESSKGTLVAKTSVYQSLWFIILQVFMVVVTVGVMIKTKLFQRKRYGVILLHISLILILVGALVTHIFGYEGMVHIREGQKTQTMMMLGQGPEASTEIVDLPFSLELKDFLLERYPGSQSPSSYESFLIVEKDGQRTEEHIYMNRVLDLGGYRIFQTSYDPDELGSVLTINCDPYGTSISYFAYALMCLGFLLVIVGPNTYFRVKLRELNSMYKKSLTVLVMALVLPVTMSYAAPREVSKDFAAKFGALQVQSPTGRMEPVNTYSKQILRKLTRSNYYKGMNSDQVLLGMLAFPEQWAVEPILSTDNPDLQKQLSIKGEEFSYSDLFNVRGEYILEDSVQSAYTKAANQRNRYDKELIKIDERANILYGLQQRMFLAIFPDANGVNDKWLSAGDDLSSLQGDDLMFVSRIMDWLEQEVRDAVISKNWEQAEKVLGMIDTFQQKRSSNILQTPFEVKMELLYNKMNVFSRATFAYMGLGLVLLIFSLMYMNKKEKWSLKTIYILIGLIAVVFLLHSLALATRAYISGRAPWANGYESMIYVAWSTLLAGFIFIKRSYLTLALSTFLGGVVLLVAHLNFMDPQITPLVPVLKSYWLMLHVAIITSSYSFFGISFMLSSLNMSFVAFKKQTDVTLHTIKELRIISELSLTLGLALLSIGTFLGAIWANESWGRYWGWDPKETWALISMLVYALVLHTRYIPKMNTNLMYNTLTIYALGSILMTYFGVNYYLNGLHSYAGGTTPPALWGVFVIYALISYVVFMAWKRSWRKG